jgi:lysyl-tRNA synthetase class II
VETPVLQPIPGGAAAPFITPQLAWHARVLPMSCI